MARHPPTAAPALTRSLALGSGLCLCGCAPDGLDFGGSLEPARAACSASLGPSDVQGNGLSSPRLGQRLDVAGVVSLVFDASDGSNARGREPGFFIQSRRHDADPGTSEGLFVAWQGRAPELGTVIRARGVAAEVDGLTRLDGVERVDECDAGELSATPIDARMLDAPEAVESAWVSARADWALVDIGGTASAPRLVLSPAGRRYATGHELGAASPLAPLWSLRLAPPASEVMPAAASAPAGPRLGWSASALEGVLELDGDALSLLCREVPAWTTAPGAPARAAPERLRVVGLNLDNYFVTPGARGARTATELGRQRDKLVALLLALDADVLALSELENAGARALEHLLEGLDARLAPALAYRFEEAAPPGESSLRAALAYRPARVRARGAAWFETRPGYQRAPLFQAFERGGAPFVVGVVHFKSKRCGDEPTLVPAGGCGDDTRVAEAELLVETAREVSGRNDGWLLVMGDYNADPLEAPLTTLERAGFRDLLDALPDADRYSYVYAGRASLLDHALAAPGRHTPPAEVAIWHINADEPAFRGHAFDASTLADARRSSDHDPVIVDLQP